MKYLEFSCKNAYIYLDRVVNYKYQIEHAMASKKQQKFYSDRKRDFDSYLVLFAQTFDLEIARKTRRSLLIVSVMMIFIGITGIYPKEIPGLGIEIKAPDFQIISILFIAFSLYFFIYNLIYLVAVTPPLRRITNWLYSWTVGDGTDFDKDKMSKGTVDVYKNAMSDVINGEYPSRPDQGLIELTNTFPNELKFAKGYIKGSIHLKRIIEFYFPVIFYLISLGCFVCRIYNL